MKIVIAAEIFPPDIGGPATYSKRIAEELDQKGFEVRLICYSDKIQNDTYPFPLTRIIRTASPLKHYFSYLINLFKLAKDCDLIYAQGPVSSGLPAIVAGFFLGKKVVVKVVGDYAWEQARNSGLTDIGIDQFQKQKLTGKVAWLKKIESFVCRQAKQVIVPSQYLRGIVTGWGISQEKISVIYNAFESVIVPSAKIHDPNLIVSVGRLVPWKGFKTLIELMPTLLEKNSALQLKIFGAGPQEQELNNLVSQLKLEEEVSIVSLDREQLINELSGAGVFVLNTGYEGLSHTILEAISVGVPVVTTNIGGNPEIIQHGETGFLVEYDNKEQIQEIILKLCANSELRNQTTEQARVVLDKFTLESMMLNTIKVFEDL